MYELETSESGAISVNQAPSETISVSSPSKQNLGHIDKKSHVRSPSIKFLGKRSLIKHKTMSATTAISQPLQVVAPVLKFVPVTPTRVIKEGNGVDFSTLKRGAMFGRPALSQREMDAIENGGATN